MRGFHLYVLSAPPGFASSVKLINHLATATPDGLSTVASRVLSAVEGRGLSVPVKDACEVLRPGMHGLTEEQIGSVISSLSYLYRGVVQHSSDAEAVGEALGQYSDLSTPATAIIQGALTGAKGKVASALSVGRLEGLEWSLGVAVQSSRCKNLMMPFVRMVFKLAAQDGTLTVRAVELSYSEFQDVLETFTEISEVLERV